jgi:Tol biopolymer transport system component
MKEKKIFVWLGQWLASFWLLGGISSCNSPLLIAPQVPVGGLNSFAADQSPSYSGDGRYLAFASDRSGRRSIYLFDLQEKRLVNLPNLNRRDSSQDQPSLNADGRLLAYISTERGKSDVMVYDRFTARATLLTANVRGTVRNPTISGDGSQVAFETNQDGQWNIAIVNRITS